MDKGFENVVDFINDNDLNSECIVIYKDEWYDIVHNDYVAQKIQTDDVYAKKLNDILFEELISEDITNFSIYENEEIIKIGGFIYYE